MQSVQRQFGKLMGKTPADSAKTNALIKDYEDIERAIAKVGIVQTHSSQSMSLC